jgi:hypothetical protein
MFAVGNEAVVQRAIFQAKKSSAQCGLLVSWSWGQNWPRSDSPGVGSLEIVQDERFGPCAPKCLILGAISPYMPTSRLWYRGSSRRMSQWGQANVRRRTRKVYANRFLSPVCKAKKALCTRVIENRYFATHGMAAIQRPFFRKFQVIRRWQN